MSEPVGQAAAPSWMALRDVAHWGAGTVVAADGGLALAETPLAPQ